MNTRWKLAAPVALAALCAAAPLHAGSWEGTLQVGGTIRNETGDRSAVQETFDVYDGFDVGQVRLAGALAPGHSLALDLRDVNLSSRRGDVSYRIADRLWLNGRFDQHRQVWDPARLFDTFRKDWHADAQYTPLRWLTVSANADVASRTGDRVRFPAVAPGAVPGPALGPLVNFATHDDLFVSGDATVEARRGRQGAAFTARASDYRDDLAAAARRRGRVVALRAWTPSVFYDRWQHLVRVSFGERRLVNGGLEHTYGSLQYTGVIQPVDRYLFQYVFAADRTDDRVAGLRTDRFQNDAQATWFHRYGWLRGGGGYETKDDDRSLTSARTWNVAGAVRDGKYATLKAEYASRVRKDEEELTLLKDVESSQFRGRLELRPCTAASLGGTFVRRQRDFTDIGVASDGRTATGFVRGTLTGWGALEGDYSWADDDWNDATSRFRTLTRAVTSRVECSRVPRVQLACGVTWLEVTRDVEIEKSILFAELGVRLPANYRLELKGNVYDYDDYVLLDRYYTANVLSIGLAYDFRSK